MLPIELLTQIFREVRGPRTTGPYAVQHSENHSQPEDRLRLISISQLCLASKTFYQIATPMLYEYLEVVWEELEPTRQTSVLLETLASRADLGRCILKLRVSDISPNVAYGDNTALAEVTEFLISVATGLEQLILDRATHSEDDERLMEGMRKPWTKTLSGLTNCPNIRSLWVREGATSFELPSLPQLQDLQLAEGDAAVSLSSSFPSLITLCLPGFDSQESLNLTGKLELLLPQLQNVFLDGMETTPLLAIKILTSTPNLKVFQFDLKFGQWHVYWDQDTDSDFVLDLPDPLLIGTLQSLERIEKLEVIIWHAGT